jgi:hypothetical protein
MKPDVEYLVSQGLIEFKSIPHEETGFRQMRTLTNNDHRFLTHTQSDGKVQAPCHGFFEPREAHHDADLYRLCTVSRSFEERLPRPTFESNTKLAMWNGVAWTLNLPPVTTAVEISPKKYAQDSRSALTRMMCQSSG